MKRVLLLCLALAMLVAPAYADTLGTAYTRLTAASATACTSIVANPAGTSRVLSITNTGAAQTVFLTLYDEGASPTCAATDLVYGDGTTIVLGAGATVTLNIPLTAGLAYKLSAASTGAIIIVRQ